MATRPTSDRLRETLFNVLAPRIQGARFLDLYAGSGAVGIEAASRGAERVVLVERAATALKVLRANLENLGIGIEKKAGVRRKDSHEPFGQMVHLFPRFRDRRGIPESGGAGQQAGDLTAGAIQKHDAQRSHF